MRKEKHSVLIVGLGKIGLSHLSIFGGVLSPEKVAVLEPSKRVRQTLGRVCQIQAYSDVADVDTDRFTHCVISTPPIHHLTYASWAVDNNLDVLIEKPIVVRAEDLDAVDRLARTHHTPLTVGYVNRYLSTFTRVGSLISEGMLGDITSATGLMTGNVVTTNTKANWRNDPESGGGCLFEYAAHLIDLARYLLGELTLEWAFRKRVHSQKGDDIVRAGLVANGNVPVGLTANWCEPSARKATNEFQVSGTNGKVLVNKYEISLHLSRSHGDVTAGWHHWTLPSLAGPVPYYLRGEEFTSQAMAFLNYDSDSETRNSLKRTIGSDRLLHEIAQEPIR